MFFNFDNPNINNLNRENYYTLLGLKKTATIEEIKKAYRKLSLTLHPDRNSGDSKKSELFSKITDAYTILSDPEKRRKYDFELSFEPSNLFNMILELNKLDSDNIECNYLQPNYLDPNNIDFSNFLFNLNKRNSANCANSINSVNSTYRSPETIFKDLTITLLQSYEGCKLPVNIKKWRIEYKKKIEASETIYVDIPKGIDDGEIIRIEKKGNTTNDKIVGDIEIKIQISGADSFFSREGLDLIYKKNITLKESLCGFSFDIKFLDGKEFQINNKPGNIIPPFFRKVIKDMGFERENVKGNLIIVFNVIYPKELSAEVIQNLNKLL